MYYILLCFVFLSITTKVFASPCCGSGSAAPSIISSDDASQISFSIGRSTIIGDAPERGIPVFRNKNFREYTQSYTFSAGSIFLDRFQFGGSIPVIQHSVSKSSLNESGTGIGDIKLNLGYETIPEWEYSEWKPKAISYLQLIIPTGKSVYESQTRLGTDAIGKGFYSLGIGTLFIKKWIKWDMNLIPEIHYSFKREFVITDEKVAIVPGFGMSIAYNLGYNISLFRIGFRLSPNYNQNKKIHSTLNGNSTTSYQSSWDVGGELSYMFSDLTSGTLSYIDQTILGPASNCTLSRTFAFSFQKRFER